MNRFWLERRHAARNVLLSALALAGCGPELDRISEIESVRVLAVQKSLPYAPPGETVNLTMLSYDGRPAEQRTPLQRLWFSGCFNPPGDQYYGCFAQAAGLFGVQGEPDGDGRVPLTVPEGTFCPPQQGAEEGTVCVGSGETFSFQMPSTILDARTPIDPDQPPYGLAMVFFAVCGGQLALAAPSEIEELGFPLVCLDDQGNLLGARDFVVGYSSVYSYAEVRNTNPEIEGFEVSGADASVTCFGDECLTTPVATEACDPAAPTLPVCLEEDTNDCPGYPVKPAIDPSVVEPDTIATLGRREAYGEQMWINYHVDAGSVKSDARLLNDATAGFNEDFGTEIRMPSEPGPVHLWAVVRDNRGGVGWARTQVCAEATPSQ